MKRSQCDFMRALTACVVLLLFSSGVRAQSNSFPWPMNPPVGIGTQSSTPLNALHIHYNPGDIHSDTAILRLSYGDAVTSNIYGILGIMPGTYDTGYTTLSRGTDLVLHEQSQGDIILSNFSSTSVGHPYGAIRFATSPDSSLLPLSSPGHQDLERMTILGNGNVGIDLPPDTSTTGLGNPKDQVQIGGGSVAPPGYTTPIPGLTLYGGNRFEGMRWGVPPADVFPVVWRYISFNGYGDHMTGATTRFAPMSSSTISFADATGGLLNFSCFPYDSSRGMTDFTHISHTE